MRVLAVVVLTVPKKTFEYYHKFWKSWDVTQTLYGCDTSKQNTQNKMYWLVPSHPTIQMYGILNVYRNPTKEIFLQTYL